MNILFHPAVVHLPIGLALVLPLIAIWIFWRHRAAWSLVVLLLLLMAGAAQLAMFTGEGIEDSFKQEHPQPAAKAGLHEHEERAEALAQLAIAGLLVSAGGLWVPIRFRRYLQLTTLCLVLILALQAVRTGHAGGELVWGIDGKGPGSPAAVSGSAVEEDDYRK
jgi:uncharacterized membrane protein